jgi:predicted DNA-binding ribbon-helix-helix protein
MELDLPGNLPEADVQRLTKRIHIIDSLIDSHNTTISDLFKKGFDLEDKLKADNANFSSSLRTKFTEFNSLRNSYKPLQNCS